MFGARTLALLAPMKVQLIQMEMIPIQSATVQHGGLVNVANVCEHNSVARIVHLIVGGYEIVVLEVEIDVGIGHRTCGVDANWRLVLTCTVGELVVPGGLLCGCD